MFIKTLPWLDRKFLLNWNNFMESTSPKNKVSEEYDQPEVLAALRHPVQPMNLDRATQLIANNLNLNYS